MTLNPNNGAAPSGETFRIETSDGATLIGHRFGSGRGNTPIVLVHCWMGDHTTWQHVTERLAATHQVVVFDVRGHGQSTTGASDPSMPRLAADLAEVIDTLGLPAPLVAGHSLGGMVAIEAACTGQPLAGIGLVGTSPCTTHSWWQLQATSKIVASFVGSRIGDALFKSPLGRLLVRGSFGPRTKRQAIDHTLATVRQTDRSVRRRQFELVGEFDARGDLAKVDVPATIVAGRFDTLLPVEHSRLMHERIPTSSLTVLAGAGHMLPLERPDEVAAAIGALAG